MIITANTWFRANGQPPKTWETFRRGVIIPAMVKSGLQEQQGEAEGPPLIAFVNHGRWLVQCECAGAEYVWEEGQFMCMSCLNAEHKHHYRRSVFPAERLKIEALLEKRPLPNRNWDWHKGEDIALLEYENIEHREELL